MTQKRTQKKKIHSKKYKKTHSMITLLFLQSKIFITKAVGQLGVVA